MNETKAREHFSAYYLGELDAGIRQAFERTLESNSQVAAEYRAFERTMKEIASLRDVRVDVPEDLVDRITARIDKQVWEQRRTEKPGLATWWRSLALGGVATVAVLGAVISVRNAGNVASSSLIPIAGAPMEQVYLAEKDGGYALAYQTSDHATVVVRSGIDGPEVARFELNGQRLHSPLKNESKVSALLSIEVESKEALLVAVPGTDRVSEPKGEGSLVDLAKAIAGFYRKPVQLEADNPDARVAWGFVGAGPDESKLTALDGNHVSVAKLSSGAYSLQDR